VTCPERLAKLLDENFTKLTSLLGLDQHPVADFSKLNDRAKCLFQFLEYIRTRRTEPSNKALLGDLFAYNITHKMHAVWLALPCICNYNHPDPLEGLDEAHIAALNNSRTKEIVEPLLRLHQTQTQTSSPKPTGTY
jgi:hypothetical protein